MIPKIIHYCWYGENPMPELLQKCLSSWENFLPGYQMIRWNEDNTDFDNAWLIQARNQKKYAFISDYVRFKALKEYGGIYLDTDMLVMKTLDQFLDYSFFCGFEDEVHVNAAIIGAEKGHPLLDAILEKYEKTPDSKKFMVITTLLTPVIKGFFGSLDSKKVQEKDGVAIFPPEYFYPIPYQTHIHSENLNSYFTEKSVAAHLWNKSWYDEFSYFSIQEYRKGFGILFKKLRKNPFQPPSYFKFLIYSLLMNFKKSIIFLFGSSDKK